MKNRHRASEKLNKNIICFLPNLKSRKVETKTASKLKTPKDAVTIYGVKLSF